MTIVPVIKENIATGRIGRYVHGMEPADKATLCGITVYQERANVQLSVEPEGTTISCPWCVALATKKIMEELDD